MNYLYLIVNLFSLIPTLLFSFHPKIKFYQHWKYALPAILLVAIVFIMWDNYYTHLGVWGFNPKYIVGTYFANLPLEEVLFFICIPYACIYTYYCLNRFISKDYFHAYERVISFSIITFLLSVVLLHQFKYYTTVVFVLLSLSIGILSFLKTSWLSRFYFSYLFLLIPFLLVNGVLTGTGLKEPVVWYNADEILGFRICTIPFEDIFYGMLMLLASVALYEFLKQTRSHKVSG